jgi:hypothetical protein
LPAFSKIGPADFIHSKHAVREEARRTDNRVNTHQLYITSAVSATLLHKGERLVVLRVLAISPTLPSRACKGMSKLAKHGI